MIGKNTTGRKMYRLGVRLFQVLFVSRQSKFRGVVSKMTRMRCRTGVIPWRRFQIICAIRKSKLLGVALLDNSVTRKRSSWLRE